MWPFSRATEITTSDELERRVAKLETRLEEFDVEWSEWYDKYRRLYARIAKRVERDSDSHQDAPQSTETPLPKGNGVHRAPRSLRGF